MTVSSQASQAALISGISVPDSKLANEITEFIRDTEPTLLFNHSSRVYYFGALAGQRRGLKFDAELLYAGAMFHDIGLVPAYSSDADRFRVWTAIALHTTPGIPQYMHPVVALVTVGVEMDVLGIDYSSFTDSDRNAVVQAFPRTAHFKEDILQAFYDGIKHKPETTFGNVKADVLADKEFGFQRGNFCSVIRNSSWRG